MTSIITITLAYNYRIMKYTYQPIVTKWLKISMSVCKYLITMSEAVSSAWQQGGELSMGVAAPQTLRLEWGQTSFSFSEVLLFHIQLSDWTCSCVFTSNWATFTLSILCINYLSPALWNPVSSLPKGSRRAALTRDCIGQLITGNTVQISPCDGFGKQTGCLNFSLVFPVGYLFSLTLSQTCLLCLCLSWKTV